MASIWGKAGQAGIAGRRSRRASAFSMWVTAPERQPPSHWANLGEPILPMAKRLFWAGGCASCHAAPNASGDALKTLSGGQALPTPFGTFHVPNISPDSQHGLGSWTVAEFGDAMTRGVGKNGEHLYPSFPYTSYARMTAQDINDLFGYLKTLPASTNDAPPSRFAIPARHATGARRLEIPLFRQGRATCAACQCQRRCGARANIWVEGPGHCGECHTPRTALGGLSKDKWLAGGPNPEGEGTIPDITPGSQAIGSWTVADIASYLETGFTPDFDSVGGSMVKVQQNMAKLSAEDRNAIAAYLKAIPAR